MLKEKEDPAHKEEGDPVHRKKGRPNAQGIQESSAQKKREIQCTGRKGSIECTGPVYVGGRGDGPGSPFFPSSHLRGCIPAIKGSPKARVSLHFGPVLSAWNKGGPLS